MSLVYGLEQEKTSRNGTSRFYFFNLLFFCVQTAGGMKKGGMCQALTITFITNDETILKQL